MSKVRKAPGAKKPTHKALFAKVPIDLAARIRAEADRLGYPHTVSSVIYQVLAERFPAEASKEPTP